MKRLLKPRFSKETGFCVLEKNYFLRTMRAKGRERARPIRVHERRKSLRDQNLVRRMEG